MAYRSEPAGSVSKLLKVVPLGLDAFSELRYLHTTALRAQTACVLSEAEVAAFTALVRSPAYRVLSSHYNYVTYERRGSTCGIGPVKPAGG